MELLAALIAALLGTVQLLTLPNGGRPSPDVTIALDPAPVASTPPLPQVLGPRGGDRPLVVIDPGHGGYDPGAVPQDSELREKDVTLTIARAIRDELVKSGRVRVALTRNDDSFLALQDRYEIARRLRADLFISIHADAAPNPGASGATIYTLSEVASNGEAALLAARENGTDLLGGIDLDRKDAGINRILIDLAQRESMDISARFASLLYREASASVPFRPVPHAFAAFVVLKAPDVPSILFECGYLTHAPDLAYLSSEAGRTSIATGMRRAIEANFAQRIAESRTRAEPTPSRPPSQPPSRSNATGRI